MSLSSRPNHPARWLSLCALSASVGGAAFAEPEPGEKREGTVYVYGTRDTYAADQSGSATKTDTLLIDLPQAINVLTRDLLDDQAISNVSDALRNIPGIVVAQGEGHRDAPILRGNVTTADFFVDGVRDDLQYIRDIYNTARLEVLKGPSGLIFGRGTGGGVINRVTKQADGETVRAFSAGAGSFDLWRATADFGGSIGTDAGVRLNGVYETAGSYRDFQDAERIGVSPAAGFLLSPSTRLTLNGEYYKDERLTDRGVPSVAGRPWDGSEKAFFGSPAFSQSEVTVTTLTATIDHTFNEALSVRSALIFGDYDKFYANMFAASSVSAAGAVALAAYTSATDRENLISQTDLIWKTSFLGADHTLLAGIETGRQDSVNLRIEGQFPGAANAERLSVSLLDRGVSAPVSFGRVSRDNVNELDLFAVYLQDQIALSNRIDLMAGVRFDRFDLAFVDNRGADFSREDEFFSPRLGVVFKPLSDLSLYASWSQSHLPQSGEQFGNLTATLAALEPEQFENLEAGLKWQPGRELLFTAAIYQLDRDNTIAPGPASGTSVLTGSQRSEGLELTFQGEVRPGWDIVAGYAWQDAEITSVTSAAPTGRKVAMVPEHSVSLWNKIAVTERLSLGAGFVWRGESFTTVSNTVVLPDWGRADAGVYFDLSDALSVQLNLENLTGEHYWVSAHNDNNITPGAPFAARLTLTGRF